MNLTHFDIFNPTFTFFSLTAVIISFLLFFQTKKLFSFAVRLSIFGGSVLSLVASLIPHLTQVLTVAFLPSVVYNIIHPLTLGPFIIGIIGFIATLSLLTLARELSAIVNRYLKAPPITHTIAAVFVFALMMHAVQVAMREYRLIVNSEVIAQYALKGNNPDELKKIFHDLSLSKDEKLNETLLPLLALNPHTPTDILRRIYSRTIYFNLDSASQSIIIGNLTKNPHTPPDVLEKMLLTASRTSLASSSALALIPHNPNFSDETLLQLSGYPDCEIRRAMISYPHIPEKILTQMVEHDPDVGVRRDAKRRMDFLHGLSRLDERKTAPGIKKTTMVNELEVKAQQSLSTNQLKQVYIAAEKTGIAPVVLENLAANCFINEELARNIFSKAVSSKGDARFKILLALASNPKVPRDVLENLIALDDVVILRAIAANPNLPYDLMQKLVPYPDCKVRKKLICQVNASREMIAKMQADNDQSVSLESAARLKGTDTYLESCQEIRKLNPSCQKFFDANSNTVEKYPNTSKLENGKVLFLDLFRG